MITILFFSSKNNSISIDISKAQHTNYSKYLKNVTINLKTQVQGVYIIDGNYQKYTQNYSTFIFLNIT